MANKTPPRNVDDSLIRRRRSGATRRGVNVIGHISGNLGLGVAARQAIAYFNAIGAPVATFDLDPGMGRGGAEHVVLRGPHDSHHTDVALLPHDINLFVLPPEAIAMLVHEVGSVLRIAERLNATIVFWETPVIPPQWRETLRSMQVVIATSPFIHAAFANTCPGPMLVDADLPLNLPEPAPRSRASFGLPETGTLFLAAFEPHSDPVRKNILGAIEAFKRGSEGHPDAWLIIKVNNAESGNALEITKAVEAAASEHPRIMLFKRSLAYTDLIALYKVCDAFISLHRAEGFGLVPFEMMSLGKPVIATAWSGNMAYMDAVSTCLVNYDLIPAQGQISVYRDFTGVDPVRWADPNVDEAAMWIDRLAADPALRTRIGTAAKARIQRYNTEALTNDFWANVEALAEQHAWFPTRKQAFRSDAAPLPPPAPSPAQATASTPTPPRTPWLPQVRWSPQERQWALEAVGNREQSLPRVALAILDNGHINPAGTRASLASQWSSATVIDVPVGSDGGSALNAVNRALSAVPADVAWLGVVDSGDALAADALFRVTSAIRLHPEWQLVYTDEDNLTANGQHVNPHCKPDFNLDYLRSLPYIGGLLLIRRDLFEALGGYDPDAEGAEDYDLMLRAWEHLQSTGAGDQAIGHVAEVLYHRLQGSGHTLKSVPEILAAGQVALQGHFRRLGLAVEVQPGPFPPSFRARWPLPESKPLVSILVPTRNQISMLQRCVESLIEKTRYPAYEIIVIDNASDDADTCRYLDAIASREAELGGRLRVLRQPGPFNFSAMNNAAAHIARGDYLLLLNNDTAALHDDWLDEMMSHATRPDVGIVGAKLLFPDGKIQHAGVILGMRGPAEHPFINHPPEDRGYFGRAQLVQNLSAVTGACLLVRKSVFEQVGGLDEGDFKVSYNDIDLCLKVRQAGLRIVFTPFALVLHEGSASQRGKIETAPDDAKRKRFAGEIAAMYRKWLPQLAFDPAYNRHLSLASTDFVLEDQPCLSWDPEWRPRPRILVHPADREGCGEYRIIAPMRALNRAGLTQGWETMRLFEPAEMQRMDPDVLVVQRQMEWPQIEAIERHARTVRAFRVFEIDDLITNLPVKSVHKSHIHKDIAKRFRKAAGMCNRLVVATEPLARAYAGFADEVVVCPNHIEAARWGNLQPARAERAKPRVGWAGGIGHTGDLELIADVVRETAAEVDWVFFGMCPEALKPLVKEFHPGVPLDQYPARLASLDLDLAVAPLEDNAFNEAKSHLRLLEYGILGYPVICSDLVPYQGDFPVVRVANRFRDWMRAVRDAVSDRAALRKQGEALRAKVRADWIMEDHLERWIGAWTP